MYTLCDTQSFEFERFVGRSNVSNEISKYFESTKKGRRDRRRVSERVSERVRQPLREEKERRSTTGEGRTTINRTSESEREREKKRKIERERELIIVTTQKSPT